MVSCRRLTRAMLTDPIDVRTEDESLDFERAKEIADKKAGEIAEDPMLISWFDKKTGTFSPKLECCGEEKPTWLIYAESRGGKIIIDINQEEYVFVYHS